MLRPLSAWLSDSVGGAGHRTQFRRGLELTLMTQDGSFGLGEASPLPNFSHERYEQVEGELTQIGEFDVELAAKPGDCLELVRVVAARTGCCTPSARFALEGALVDLLARRFGLAAASLLAQMVTKPLPNHELEISKLLSGNDSASLLGAARHALGRGYGTLKVKLGTCQDFAREFASLEVLRQRLDPSVKLRLDPNQSWPPSEAPQFLRQLRALSPELVEEPVALTELGHIDSSPVPLAMDESLRDASALDVIARHIERLDIRAIVVKPALLGLLRALELAEQAERLGLDVIVTHLFDGPIGHATASCLALAIGTRSYAHGLAPHAGLLMSPERRVLGLGAGRLRPVEQAGLPLFDPAPC